MAWSPFQRANAGIIWVEQPGDYAYPIPTTSATGPHALRVSASSRRGHECLTGLSPPDARTASVINLNQSECEWRSSGTGPRICIHCCCPLGSLKKVYEETLTATASSEADGFVAAISTQVATDGESGGRLGIASQLDSLGPTIRRNRRWPRGATRLSRWLMRAARMLQERGISIDLEGRSRDKVRRRLRRTNFG